MFCFCAAQLKFWFKTDLGRENSASYYRQGRQLLLTLITMVTRWSRVGHALRPIFTLWLVKIWQVSSRGKFMQHLETCLLLTAEADRVLSQLVMFFYVILHWMYKMKYSCYQESTVIHGWFVYWVFGSEMHCLSKLGNPISDCIVFVFHLA